MSMIFQITGATLLFFIIFSFGFLFGYIVGFDDGLRRQLKTGGDKRDN